MGSLGRVGAHFARNVLYVKQGAHALIHGQTQNRPMDTNPLIADHLEQSAWWPDHELREGWNLGEYSLYAIGFRTAGLKGLYVRFISNSEDPDLKKAEA